MSLLRRASLIALLLSSCHISVNDPGTEPPTAQLFYPNGMALDPDGRYLYVANSNGDLRFEGGTLEMVDLFRFHCAANARKAALAGQTFTPVAGCDHISEDLASCQRDPSDPGIIACDETPFILKDASVRIGNFAGLVRVQMRGNIRRLWVAVRGDPSLTFLDVDLTKLPGSRAAPAIDCFDPGFDLTTLKPDHVPPCQQSHQLQAYKCIGEIQCLKVDNVIPAEPFGMTLDEGPGYARLVVSHLAGGQVSVVDIAGDPVVTHVSTPFFGSDTLGRRGAFALAPQEPGNLNSTWYMTSTVSPTMSTFHIGALDFANPPHGRIFPGPSFSLNGFASGADVRALVFEAGGKRAFVTDNFPPTLFVLDTGIGVDTTKPDQPKNRVVDMANVCQSPSHMVARKMAVRGGDGRLQTQLFISCFLSSQLTIVDPDRAQLIDTLLVGRGPTDIVLNFGEIGETVPNTAASGGTREAYVGNYLDSTISVVDLEPGSPTEHRTIYRIGLPEEKPRTEVKP